MWGLLLLAALLLALALQPASAIFADQAGLNDWTLQNVGEPVCVASTSTLFFALTKQQVLAAFPLDASKKDFVWRRVLLNSQDEGGELLLADNGQIVISVQQSVVSAWSSKDGQLLWDHEEEDKVQQVLVTGNSVVILSSKAVVRQLNARTGLPTAKPTTTTQHSEAAAALLPSSNGFKLVEVTQDGQVRVGGAVVAEDAASPSSAASLAVSSASGWLAYTNKQGGVSLLKEQHKVLEFSKSQVRSLSSKHGLILATLEEDGGGSVVVALVVDGEEVKAVPHRSGLFASSASSAVWSFGGEEGTVQRLIGGGGAGAVASFSSAVALKQGWEVGNGQLMVGVGSDASLSLFKINAGNHKLDLLWQREECLAEVDQIVSVRLHLASTSGKSSASLSLVELITAANQAATKFSTNLVDVVQLAVEGGQNFVRSKTGNAFVSENGNGGIRKVAVSVSDERERARFGFNRALILLTRAGKMVALHSETKQVLWTMLLPFAASSAATKRRMFVLNKEEEVAVVDYQAGAWVRLSALTGKLVAQSSTSTSPIAQAAPLAHSLLLLSLKDGDDEMRVEEHPARSTTPSASSVVYVPHWNDETKTFSGYAVSLNTSSVLAWRLGFSPATAQLLALVQPPEHEVVSSPVRALGDGGLLVKYINPHLHALLVGELGDVKVLLVDVVSGRVVHRATHRDASGPVHAVRFEHWLVYSYWNARAARTELVSVCLYDQKQIGKKQVNPWTASPLAVEQSSLDGTQPALQVYTKHFLLPGQDVTHVGVTTTLRGIASKNLLVSLGGTGQVLMLDQRLIDPRRPLGPPTEEEKLEGLFQYQAELPVVPQHVISYYLGTGERGAKVFHVAPSQLESTCTVVAAGLDVFKGRASPSGAFDLLAEDFDYVLLVSFIVALAVGVAVLRRMDRAKSLQAAWV